MLDEVIVNRSILRYHMNVRDDYAVTESLFQKKKKRIATTINPNT